MFKLMCSCHFQVVLTTNKMEEMKKEYEMKLDEYARLLDLRQARIKVK